MKKVLFAVMLSMVSGLSACKVTEVVKAPTTPADSAVVISVNPGVLALTIGQSQAVVATVGNSRNEPLQRTVTWTSSDPSKVSVNAQGVVTGIGQGTAIITARTGNLSAQLPVAVSPVPVSVVLFTPSSSTAFVGQTVTPTLELRGPNDQLLTNRFVTFGTSNNTVATVSATGVITAVGSGVATITATSEGRVGNFTLTVNVVPVSTARLNINPIVVGRATRATLTLQDAQGNTLTTTGRNITWSTSDANVLTVSSSGDITGVTVGSATVVAIVDGRVVAQTVQVGLVRIDSVTIMPLESTPLAVGSTRQFSAMAFDSTGTAISTTSMGNRRFMWSTETPGLVAISSNGLVTATSPGEAFIVATVDTLRIRKSVLIVQ